MRTLYLHCGAPKTGTSFLQVLFARHADVLKENNIIYPHNSFTEGASKGKITSGNGILMANYLRPQLPHHIENKDIFIDDFDRMLREGEGKDFLFSSEFLVFPRNERTQRLVDVINGNGYNVKALYFVRDIADAARSAYSQQVKRHGEVKNFADFLKTWDGFALHHTNLIASAFGEDSLSLFNYGQHKEDLAKFVFRDFLGCDFDPDFHEKINRSLTDKEMDLLISFNSVAGDGNAFASTFVSDALMRMNDVAYDDFLPNEEEFEILDGKFSNAVKGLNRRIIGEPIRISKGVRGGSISQELSDFERFTMAVLAKLVNNSRNR